jgi:RND family efflux transporter MFP subunit
VATAKVTHDEAKMAFDRAKTTWESGLTSQEAYDTAIAQLQSAEVQLEKAEIQLSYTEIRAPFDALVVARHIRLAQYVNSGANLFRISDFTPLLCPIEIPEKDLSSLSIGQQARILVESYPNEEFSAKVLRIRPTVDAATGTVTVTLEVDGRGKLRPGMFASAYVETETHENAVVIRRDALVLDSLGDTVFVRDGDKAVRRDVRLGFREDQLVEVIEGLDAGEELIVLGQDGLADGTPISVLDESTPAAPPAQRASGAPTGGPTPEMLEMIKQRMKERGMSDEQIEERLKQMQAGGGAAPGRMGPPPGGGLPPMLEQRIKEASAEDLERIRKRMKDFGMDEATIDAEIKRIRGDQGE